MDEKLRPLLEKTLQTTIPLAEAAVLHDTKFLNVLLGIYRVSFSTLRDIYYLSSNKEAGASALDLTRKIIEYGVTVEYWSDPRFGKGKNPSFCSSGRLIILT